MKTYTTGQVAAILKLSGFELTARKIAKLIDDGELDGHMKESQFQRRSTRRVPVRDLIVFMQKRDISFAGFDGDAYAQKVLLRIKTSEFECLVARARKHGDIFLSRGISADDALAFVYELGSPDNLLGASKNRSWAKVLRKVAEVMETHTKLRHALAKLKKKR